jgi:hypothetical protein
MSIIPSNDNAATETARNGLATKLGLLIAFLSGLAALITTLTADSGVASGSAKAAAVFAGLVMIGKYFQAGAEILTKGLEFLPLLSALGVTTNNTTVHVDGVPDPSDASVVEDEDLETEDTETPELPVGKPIQPSENGTL